MPAINSPSRQRWQQFFSSRGLSIDPPTLQVMHRAYGGNAKAMGILCGAIQEDFAGDMAAYWQEHHADPLAVTDLKNLVTSQANRLQLIDPQAYRLFCLWGVIATKTYQRFLPRGFHVYSFDLIGI